jgi:hypothetical protein
MPEAPWWTFILMLILIPVGAITIFLIHKDLPQRLVFFFAAGLTINHWMHVWCYRLADYIKNPGVNSKQQVLFAFRIDWKIALFTGILIFFASYIVLRWKVILDNDFRFTHIFLLGAVSVLLSQTVTSSIPKLTVDAACFLIFIIGLFAWKYFMTYPSNEVIPPYQIQSDSLTSFGLLFSFLTVWVPGAIAFGSFLYNYYGKSDGLELQLQMTRYAAGVAWTLVGCGMVLYDILTRLINARLKYKQ